MIIVDSDILSMFAKADKIDLLIDLFDDDLSITPKIRDEIIVPKEYGYDFPDKIISKIDTYPLDKKAINRYEKYQDKIQLGKGEIEAISLCKINGFIFCTNDHNAREFAKEEGIDVISLQAVLRSLWVSDVLEKDEVKDLLKTIIEVDNLSISNKTKKAIFQE